MNNTWWIDSNQLDKYQMDVMALPLEGKFLIEGPPGSGKTNLLALRAKYLFESKRENFAIITFTRSLKSFLRLGLSQYTNERYEVNTYNQWANGFLRQFGKPYPSEKKFNEARELILNSLESLVSSEQGLCFYDTILVDEAQDYNEREISVFQKFAQNLFFVADIKQRIFPGSSESTDFMKRTVDKTITLKYHYRNGLKICKLADAIAKDRSYSLLGTSQYDESNNPSQIYATKYDSLEMASQKAVEQIENQANAFPDELIGIIFPSNSIMESFKSNIHSSSIFDKILFHTNETPVTMQSSINIYGMVLHNAKGLEFRTVHLFGWDQKNLRNEFNRNITYTGVTRAKTILSIYYIDNLLGYFKQAISSLEPATPPVDINKLFGRQ